MFDDEFKAAAKEYGIDFSPTKPAEVMAVINNKDAYRRGVLQDIFDEIFDIIVRYQKPPKVRRVNIKIFLGSPIAVGGPKWELDWLTNMIQRDALGELASRKLITIPKERRRETDNGQDYFVMVFHCVYEDFLDWYGEETLGWRPLGKLTAFHPKLAEALGDVASAIFYLQIYDWWEKEANGDEWVAKSVVEIKNATFLTLEKQKRIRKQLIAKGILEVVERPNKGHLTLHYKPLQSPSKISAICGNPAYESKETKLTELFNELIAISETMRENPSRKLWKYANKRTGELPEITDNGKSKFAKTGDQKIATKDFQQFDGEENSVLNTYEEWRKLGRDRQKIIEKIKNLHHKK